MKMMTSALLATMALALVAKVAFANDEKVQGWTREQRQGWYLGSQGSRLLPLKWFEALERADAASPLSDGVHLASFGYVFDAGSSRFPIGFAVDQQDDSEFKVTKARWYADQKGGASAEPWIGLNCSACHTAQISFKGKPIRIDGGPSLTDFQSFVEAVDAAMRSTRLDGAKWEKFAAKVLAGKDTPDNRKLLSEEFDRILSWQEKTARLNETPLRYGQGRVDAFGHIFNKVVLLAGSEELVSNPSDAPVSFPFLWNIHRQTHVQWNGIAANSKVWLGADYFDYGAMGRNTGEVIGVFGEVVITPRDTYFKGLGGFVSSIDLVNQDRMESLVEQLEPPKWPDAFPPIDEQLAASGRKLFAANCTTGCHNETSMVEKTETLHRFSGMQDADRTDIWMACNAYSYIMPSGLLSGGQTRPNSFIYVRDGLSQIVAASMLGKKAALAEVSVEKIFGGEPEPPSYVITAEPLTPREQRRRFCRFSDDDLLAYKARPLDGIWATAPYLHNGSVPTLYDLLLPAAERPRQFYVGDREYDPRRVGYVQPRDGATGQFLFITKDGDGNPIDGNGNQGHEYRVGDFSDADRWALVEYLKTL